MDDEKAPMQLRITDAEKELLRKKSIEINKLLLKYGKSPATDSKLLHKILEISMPYVTVNTKGEIVLERE